MFSTYLRLIPLSMVMCGCASQYERWDDELTRMASGNDGLFKVEDVSFLLSSPPAVREPLPDQLFVGLDLDSSWFSNDVTVERVVPGSPAAKANFKTGDVVLRIAGVDIHEYGEPSQAIMKAVNSGEPLQIATKRRTITVQPKESEYEQVYWNISAGHVAQFGATQQVAGGSARQRFYRAVCRFRDGVLIGYNSHWQE